MSYLVRFLITDTWWSYNPSGDWFTHVYSWFNVVEGCFWLVFSALVLQRYLKHRRSGIELLYSAAFFTFGLSDFGEAYRLESWLVLIKAVNLAALLWLRWHVLRRHHPQHKAF